MALTKAEKARQNGLEALAKIIMSQNTNNLTPIALKYTNNQIKTAQEAMPA